MAADGQRENGTVRAWFRTYGFITPDAGGGDVFVHHTAINAKGFRELVVGERVSFVRAPDECGRGQAVAVERQEAPAEHVSAARRAAERLWGDR